MEHINFKNVNFQYDTNETQVLKSINLNILGGKMTSLSWTQWRRKINNLNLIPRFYDLILEILLIDDQSIYINQNIFFKRKIFL